MTLEVETACGHWGWQEHRYFGYAVFQDLAPRESLTGLLALSITGRRMSAEQCAILDTTAACLTLADARIWPLKMTRLVGAYGGSIAATAAGLLVEEDARIGPWTSLKSAELLIRFAVRLGEHPEPAQIREEVRSYLSEHHFVWGFGTPFRERDERLDAYRERLAPSRAVEQRYFRLADAVSAEVLAARGTPPNMGLAVGAVLLDLGVELHQIGPLASALMQHMFFAHAVEAARESPSVTRHLPDDYVRYVGARPRTSPLAAEAARSYAQAASSAPVTSPGSSR